MECIPFDWHLTGKKIKDEQEADIWILPIKGVKKLILTDIFSRLKISKFIFTYSWILTASDQKRLVLNFLAMKICIVCSNFIVTSDC